jgi:phage terminase large subunit-like protein
VVYASQYQQRPVPLEGNLIKRSDARYFGGIDPRTGQRDETLPTSFDNIVISVDCAFKTVATADYTAILVVAVSGRKRFILDVINERLDVAAMEAEIRRLRKQVLSDHRRARRRCSERPSVD